MSMVTESDQEIQRRPLSIFKGNLGKAHCTSSLEQVATHVLGGTLTSYTARARDLHAAAAASGPKESMTPEWVTYKNHKKQAMAVTFSGEFDGQRRLGLFKKGSGMVFTETDSEDPSASLVALNDDPAVRLSYVSSSGAGCHIVWEVEPIPKDRFEYKQAYDACVDRMAVLGIAANNDPMCRDVTHLAFLSHDPSALYKPVGDAVSWEMPPEEPSGRAKKKSAGRKKKSRSTSDELQEALLQEALAFLAEAGAGQNDRHLLTVGFCLKSRGHPFHEFDTWAAAAGCTCSDRQQRWDSLIPTDTSYSAIIGLAIKLGFKPTKGQGRPKTERNTKVDEMGGRGWVLSNSSHPVLLNNSIINALNALKELGYAGQLRFNEWIQQPEFQDQPLDLENFLVMARTHMEEVWRILPYIPTKDAVRNATLNVAYTNTYNPVLDRIKATAWDQVDRLSTLGEMLYSTPAGDNLANEIGALIVRGTVVRALSPGADFPYVPVIRSSKQGVGKGKSLKLIAVGGHVDDLDFEAYDHERKAQEKAIGTSIIELGEFQSLSPRGTARLKQFATQTATNATFKYDRDKTEVLLTCIVVITTNESNFLADTEHRRHPVLEVPRGNIVNLDWLRDNLAQLWAQAAYEYHAGNFTDPDGTIAVRLPQSLWAAADQRSQEYEKVDQLTDSLQEWIRDTLGYPDTLPGSKIQNYIHNAGLSQSSQELGCAMTKIGYARKTRRVNKNNAKVWVKTD